jgi:aryl-alcohol dehydrogenase-like predicted oxidoreductase
MEYRKFGKPGWNISEISFGAWAIGGDMWGPQDDQVSIKALHKAIDQGVNFIDTAQGYGEGHSEELIGQVLKDRSEKIYVATKVPPLPGNPWPPPDNLDINKAFPASYIIESCEESLKRLGREYLDIYQFHTWASAFNERNEWFEAMTTLKDQGKIRMIGVSVPDTKPDSVIGSLVKNKVDSVQVIYNLFEQSPHWNLFPVCQKMNVAVIVRVPFDEGALTGKYTTSTIFPDGDVRNHYFRGNNLKAVITRVNKIKEFQKYHLPEMSLPEIALRFCLSHPAVGTVIPGIRNINQAEQNTMVSDGKLFDKEILEQFAQFYWRKDFWFDEIPDDLVSIKE